MKVGSNCTSKSSSLYQTASFEPLTVQFSSRVQAAEVINNIKGQKGKPKAAISLLIGQTITFE